MTCQILATLLLVLLFLLRRFALGSLVCGLRVGLGHIGELTGKLLGLGSLGAFGGGVGGSVDLGL